jgi:hypothetical protein
MIETIRQTKKGQMLVFTLIVAGVGFLLGACSDPGDLIIDQATQANAEVALIPSEDGKQLMTMGVRDGYPAKECDPAHNPCKAKIGPNDAKGEPTLVSTDPNQPLKNLKRTGPIYVFSYEGSHCQGSLSGGVHTESCCNNPDC